jgi:hypothetical protein
MKPCVGGFFFWENGQLAKASYQPFPFKRAELVKKVMAASGVPTSQKGQSHKKWWQFWKQPAATSR